MGDPAAQRLLFMKDRTMYRALPYIAPFATFLLFLCIRGYLPFGLAIEYPLRVVVVAGVFLIFSKEAVHWCPSRVPASILIGIAVFVFWIVPDLVWPGLRRHWLFTNALLGSPGNQHPGSLASDSLFLASRIIGTAALVPLIEELFWRAWLMRYLISSNFEKVPLGSFTALSFTLTAVLFASEHGSYWEVGLLAGIAYNLCMIRTKNLADCIIAHGVTNLCLAIYVLSTNQWHYWL